MNRRKHLAAATTTLLATVLAALVLAPVASAERVGTTSLPGSNGAIAFVSSQDTTAPN